MFKKLLATIAIVAAITGCEKKKESLSNRDGNYFVESLGNKIELGTSQGKISLNSKDESASYNYRVGSLDADLSGEKEYSLGSSWNAKVRIFSEGTFTNRGLVFVNDKGEISLVKLGEKIEWKKDFFDRKGFCSKLSLAVKDDLLALSCGTKSVVGFDLAEGKKLWQTPLDYAVASQPLFFKEKVVVFSDSDGVYALDAKLGEVLWFVPGIINQKNKTILETKPILVKEQYIIQQTADDQIRAIDINSGEVTWQVNASVKNNYVKGKDFTNHYSHFSFSEDNLYFTNSDGFVVKIRLGNAKPEWIVPMVISKPLWSFHSAIFGVTDLGVLTAISKSDGRVIWSINLVEQIKGKKSDVKEDYDEIEFSAPIVINNKLLVVSSNNKLLSFDPINGKMLDVRKTNGFGQPFVHKGKIYLITNNGNKIIEL